MGRDPAARRFHPARDSDRLAHHPQAGQLPGPEQLAHRFARGRPNRAFAFHAGVDERPELRRRVQAGLNKGEARNALARAVFFNRQGDLRDCTFENQRYRASGLNLIVASGCFLSATAAAGSARVFATLSNLAEERHTSTGAAKLADRIFRVKQLRAPGVISAGHRSNRETRNIPELGIWEKC
jgi:hypothetical protein